MQLVFIKMDRIFTQIRKKIHKKKDFLVAAKIILNLNLVKNKRLRTDLNQFSSEIRIQWVDFKNKSCVSKNFAFNEIQFPSWPSNQSNTLLENIY